MRLELAQHLVAARSFGRCEGCRSTDTLQTHHRMTRGSGGVHGAAYHVSNDPRNLLRLCLRCHDRTLSDAAGCIELGWVVERRSGVNPHEVPALIYTVNGYGWWYLTEDGGYLWANRENVIPGYRIGLWPEQGVRRDLDLGGVGGEGQDGAVEGHGEGAGGLR